MQELEVSIKNTLLKFFPPWWNCLI